MYKNYIVEIGNKAISVQKIDFCSMEIFDKKQVQGEEIGKEQILSLMPWTTYSDFQESICS